jgi:hypothetical protein
VPDILHVDQDSTGADDGSDWDNAFNNLQDALSAAVSSGEICEIWVAEGTYRPDEGGGFSPGDRFASFNLKSGVAIFGGFEGGDSVQYPGGEVLRMMAPENGKTTARTVTMS